MGLEHEITITLSLVLIIAVIVSVLVVGLITLFFLYIPHIKSISRKEIKHFAENDSLTGISNINRFKMDVHRVLLKNKDKFYVMLKMDVVNFKAVNELFGYEVGNEVLKTIATTFKSIHAPVLYQARTGADNFFIFTETDTFVEIVESKSYFISQLKKKCPTAKKHQFTFRYGRYLIEPGETNVNEIVNKANMAHSFAKTEKKELLFDYNEELKKRVLRRTEITNKMKKALKNHEFKVYLQPKYDITGKTVMGAEALVRWIEKDGNIIYPNEFIPVFESNDFIRELDMYMFESVCKALKEWIDAGLKCIPISINFSRTHLHNLSFVDELVWAANMHEVPRNYLEVELTETAITENEAALEKLLDDLRESEFSISIDDFGAGYSSLGMLKNFKVNTLKLDRSFFTDNKDINRGNIVIAGIISIAHNLGMKVVAEGVESEEQLAFLEGVHCEAAQCYFYAKPMALEEFKTQYLLQKV